MFSLLYTIAYTPVYVSLRLCVCTCTTTTKTTTNHFTLSKPKKEGCSSNNFYFRGLCLSRCPDTYYGTELVADLDALNTPVINPNSMIVDNGSLLANRRRHLSATGDQFDQIKELRELKEFKAQLNLSNNVTDHSTLNGSDQHTTTSSNQSSVDESTNLIESSTSSSTTISNPNGQPPPTTLPSAAVGDQTQFFDLPYISHNSIKQKDLNKLILLKQQELAETVRNHENSLYYQLMKESEQQQFVEDVPPNELNSDHKQSGDERLERISICLKCHYTCRRCSGRKSTQCTACYADSQLDASGRCLFKDIASTINSYKSTSVWPSAMSFDPRVQNWITISSLVLCLFFSMAFFYLLLCRHKQFADQYNSIHHQPTVDYYRQTKRPPNETLNLESYNLDTEHHMPYEASSSKDIKSSSSFIPLLRVFNNHKPSSCNGTNHNVNYNNIPVQFEVRTSNGISEFNELNETGQEIT